MSITFEISIQKKIVNKVKRLSDKKKRYLYTLFHKSNNKSVARLSIDRKKLHCSNFAYNTSWKRSGVVTFKLISRILL